MIVLLLFVLVVGSHVDVVDFLFNFVHALFEALHALSDALHELGDFLASEEEQYNKRDDDDLGCSEVSD